MFFGESRGKRKGMEDALWLSKEVCFGSKKGIDLANMVQCDHPVQTMFWERRCNKVLKERDELCCRERES